MVKKKAPTHKARRRKNGLEETVERWVAYGAGQIQQPQLGFPGKRWEDSVFCEELRLGL